MAPKTQYLDDDGNPITAPEGMKLPPGYSLLSSKKDSTPKKSAKTLKELKAKAETMKPIVPPKGYLLKPEASVSAYTPSVFEQLRNTVANSAVGYSLEQALPKVADALHLHPTEKMGTPQSEQHKNQLLSPEYLAPALTEAIRTGPLMQAPAPKEGRAPDAISNRVEGALRASGGLTTPGNMALMAVTGAAGTGVGEISPAVAKVLGRIASGGFTLQMLKGLYDQHKEYRKAVDAGDINEAQKIQGEMGVNGVMALLAGKHALTPHPFTPVTEAPTRERTNVLHRNTAGEVRQAKGQAPSVWLSPDAMGILMKQMYPEESHVITNGFSVPRRVIEGHANDPQFAHSEIKDLLTKAHENAGESGAAFAVKRDSIQQNVNVMREELNHTWQRSLAANGDFENHLKPGVFSDLRRDIPQGMYDHLAEKGYDEHDSPQMVSEAAAKFMAGNHDKFGTSAEDASKFLDKYFTDVVAQHGQQALDSLKHVKGVAKLAKEKVYAEHSDGTAGPDGGLGDGRADRGNLQSMAGGGQGGTPESSEGTEPRSKGENPLFNREQANPTWYLKSERLISEKMKGPQAAEDVHKMLLSGGVKPEEMQWTGLDDFLKSKGKDKVTPEEVREHLANNNIQIKEVMKPEARPVEWKAYPGGIMYTPDGYNVERLASNGRYRLSTPAGMAETFATEGEAKAAVDRYRSNTRADTEPTRYSQYQLPGGTSYREMLLTMPPKPLPDSPSGWTTKVNPEETEYAGSEIRDVVDTNGRVRATLPAEEIGSYLREETARNPDNSPKAFESSHWDEPNILAHIRFNDRTGPSGEKLLHVEEVQSDWHQKGRDKGYSTPETEETKGKIADLVKQQEEAQRLRHEAIKKMKYGDHGESPKWAEEADKQKKVIETTASNINKLRGYDAVPDAPFKKTWHEMALRRLLKHAVDNGFDGLSWTPGADQNARYSLSTVADKLRYDEQKQKLTVYKDGSVVKDMPAKPEDLPGIVGKEVAQRLMEQPAGETHKVADPKDLIVEGDFDGNHFVSNTATREEMGKFRSLDEANEARNSGKIPNKDAGVRHLEGEGLEVGGSGMKGFYDKIVPDYLNKFGKKFNAKVGNVDIPVPANKYATDAFDWDGEQARVLHRGDQYQVWAPNRNNGVEQLQGHFSSQADAQKYLDDHISGADKAKSVQYLPITPEMRKSVTEEGMPLFNRLYKSPVADPLKIDDAQQQLKYAKEILAKHPIPETPNLISPQEEWKKWNEEKEDWDRDYGYLQDHVRNLESNLDYYNNKSIGELRQLSDKAKVVYLSRKGLDTLHEAFGSSYSPEFFINGASLAKPEVSAIFNNLDVYGSPHAREIKKLITQGMDDKGTVTISMIPEKGQTLSEALATLREELGHTWQKRFEVDAGKHLPQKDFKKLNEAIPESMSDYLKHEGYIPNEGTDKANKFRVLESSAKMMAENPKSLGLSEDEWAAYLFHYFSTVEKAHGKEALDQLKHITTPARHVKGDYYNATKLTRSGNEEHGGVLDGVQGGRQGRAEGTGSEEK